MLWLFFAPLFALAANLNTDRLPPKVLFHMGQKAHLLDDAKLGTIPDDVWKENIMGRGNRFGLVPYRRGFYGGKNIDTLELYANTYLGSPGGKKKEPWALRIVIKDECLSPEAVSDLAHDGMYLGWLLANVNYLAQVSFCVNPATNTCDNLIIGTQPVAGGREENVCDDVLQKFMKDMNPRVVRDTEWDASWYLRDRACIEKLDASPRTVLTALAESKWDWESRKSTYRDSVAEKTNGYGMGSMAMLVGALKDSEDPVPAALLRKLRAKLGASDIRLGPAPEGKKWVAEAGPAVIDAYSRSKTPAQLSAFRAFAEKFAESLHDPRIGEWETQEKIADSLRKEAGAL